MKHNPKRGTGPGSMSAKQHAANMQRAALQWGGSCADGDYRYQLSQAEKDELKKTGYYSTGAYRIPQTRG